MSIERDVKDFFRDNDDPPAMAISDVAAFLDVDDAVVRRWARNNDVHRVGPNFALTTDDIIELANELDDGELESEPTEDLDEGDSGDDAGPDEEDEEDEEDEDDAA